MDDSEDDLEGPFTPAVEKELAPACKALASGKALEAIPLLLGAVSAVALGPAAGAAAAGVSKLVIATLIAKSATARVEKEAVEITEHLRLLMVEKHVRKALHAYHRGTQEQFMQQIGVLRSHNETLEQLIARLPAAPLPRQLDELYQQKRSQYRSTTVDAWREKFPRTYFGTGPSAHGERLKLVKAVPWMDAATRTDAPASQRPPTPFIATQGFRALKPQAGQQLKYLKPEAFLSGRESKQEATANEGAKWLPIERVEIVQALRDAGDACKLGTTEIDSPGPRRVFLVTGGGVGKSTNVRWLEAALNGSVTKEPSEAPLAVMIEADAVRNKTAFRDFIAQLAQAIARVTDSTTDEPWTMDAITRGLESDLTHGRLVVLVDGLDHVAGDELVPFLVELAHTRWAACRVVMAGRPQALKGWSEGPSHAKSAIDADRWRFIQPAEFSEAEARAYLDAPGEESRYELVKAGLGTLALVPRVLEFARTLTPEKLAKCRTSADIYWLAVEGLIERTIEEGDELTRKMDPEHALQVLAALAFHTLCPTVTAEIRVPATSRAVIKSLRRGLQASLMSLGSSINLDATLSQLATFATIVGNGIISANETEAGMPEALVWSNRTVQEFLAAVWLASYAGDADAARMRFHVFRPEDDTSDYYYEFNVFLAEMPSEGRSPEAWVDAVSEWYRFDADKTWASEMLFRSWPTMHAIAGRAVDNWWDRSYDDLVGGKRMPAQVEAQHDGVGQALAKAAAYSMRISRGFNASWTESALPSQGSWWTMTPGARCRVVGTRWDHPTAARGSPRRPRPIGLKYCTTFRRGNRPRARPKLARRSTGSGEPPQAIDCANATSPG